VSTSTAAAAPANIRVLVRVRPFNERELRFNPTNILDIGGANTDFGSDAVATNNSNNNNSSSNHGTTVAIVDQSNGGGYGSGYDSGSGQQQQQQQQQGSARSFQYDAVFGPQSTQTQIFDSVSGIVDAVCAGYNGTIVAYGQTGSGKTHTVFGSAEVE
jgi:hypothetical protein